MSSTHKFMELDFPGTLFPLKTNLILAQSSSADLEAYIYGRVLNEASKGDSFLPQQKVFATKPKDHLRRTVKLDPVAEYFVYDVVYRNRTVFRRQVGPTRQSFGYRFENGKRIPVHLAYREYKKTLQALALAYSHSIQFDIASYFNSIYHHDLCHWFAAVDGVSEDDSAAVNQFFREISSGRSIDVLPQGIYPCKMIGNEYLKYIDLSKELRSAHIVRFMDDFTIFDNDADILRQDFVRIQQLLGRRALNINPAKTHHDNKVGDVQETLTEIRANLFEIVTDYEEVATASGVDLIETAVEIENRLDSTQVDALVGLLQHESLEESDADLILGFLRTHSSSLLELLPYLLSRFPNLIKHIYSVCADVNDRSALAESLLRFLNDDESLLEYQLFWLCAIAEDFLSETARYGDLLMKIYDLSADFRIARAKVLEVPEQGHGLKELRDERLKTGQSDWLSWSSAVGTRSLNKAERNYSLTYFSKSSPMNYLVGTAIRGLP